MLRGPSLVNKGMATHGTTFARYGTEKAAHRVSFPLH
jgi:hypothetical protein